MELGVVFPQTEIGADPEVIANYARTAEAAGYRHVLAFDHVVGADPSVRPDWSGYALEDNFHEPLVLFGYLSAVTRMSFVSGVLVLPQRQTVLVAKQAAAVDILSAGRLRLGVGLGWNEVEYAALGREFHARGRMFDGQIAMLRALWTQPVITQEGPDGLVVAAGIAPLPVQQPIPIWLGGGRSPHVLDRVGRLGDGFIPNPRELPPGPGLDEALARIQHSAKEAGRDPSTLGLQGMLRLSDILEDKGTSAGAPTAGQRAALRQAATRWQDAGATHLAVMTSGLGLRGEQHGAAVAWAAEALG